MDGGCRLMLLLQGEIGSSNEVTVAPRPQAEPLHWREPLHSPLWRQAEGEWTSGLQDAVLQRGRLLVKKFELVLVWSGGCSVWDWMLGEWNMSLEHVTVIVAGKRGSSSRRIDGALTGWHFPTSCLCLLLPLLRPASACPPNARECALKKRRVPVSLLLLHR